MQSSLPHIESTYVWYVAVRESLSQPHVLPNVVAGHWNSCILVERVDVEYPHQKT